MGLFGEVGLILQQKGMFCINHKGSKTFSSLFAFESLLVHYLYEK